MLRLTILTGFILALALPVCAQVQSRVQLDQAPQLDPIIGAPTVAITRLDLFKPTTLGTVGIEWSVQKPTLTQISRFDVSFDVNYEKGGSQHLSKSITDSSVRSVSFSGLPGLSVANTKTLVTTIFTTPGTLTESEVFTLGTTALPPPRPKALDITQVTRVTQGCSATQDCFEVKWNASTTNFPSLQSFNNFNVKLDVGYSNGTVVSGNASASGTERQKIIAVTRPPGSLPQTASVTINAAVTLRGSTTVVRQTP